MSLRIKISSSEEEEEIQKLTTPMANTSLTDDGKDIYYLLDKYHYSGSLLAPSTTNQQTSRRQHFLGGRSEPHPVHQEEARHCEEALIVTGADVVT